MNNERLQHDVTIPRGEQQMGKGDFGGTSPRNMGLGEVAKEDKIQELLTHYTGDDYLKELLEDFKEGYDFNFDEDAIKEEGILDILHEAGFELREPGCSACLAMNDDKIPPGKYAVSTSNRNFEGRQGPGSRTLLASPLVAAAAAVTGKVTDPRGLMQADLA